MAVPDFQSLMLPILRFVASKPEAVPIRAVIENLAGEGMAGVSAKTPLEAMESGYQTLRAALATDLLERVRSCTPAFFERLVVELVVKMGYGGSRADAGKALGRSGDGGIDGIISEGEE